VAGSPWAELLETRFFVLAVFLLLLFVAFPWKKLWPHFLYMLCFPLIFLLWRIPSRLWRSNEPFGTLIYFNVLSSAALSVADWLRIFLLIFIGFVLTVHITNPIAFQLGAAFLFVGLAGHYYARVKQATKPIAFLAISAPVLTALLQSDFLRSLYTLEETTAKREETVETKRPLRSEERRSRVKTPKTSKVNKDSKTSPQQKLAMSLLLNRALLFFATNLRDFQRRRAYLPHVLLGVIFTLLLTVIVFAFLHYGLWKNYPHEYSGAAGANFLDFLFLSMSLFHVNFTDIAPDGTTAKIITFFEWIIAAIYTIMVMTLVVSSFNERYKEEIDLIVDRLHRASVEVEDHIKAEYKINVENALKTLREAPDAFASLILVLSGRIKQY
jgi:hypothetical protein